jgi:Mg-chelatase subunit ChlD
MNDANQLLTAKNYQQQGQLRWRLVLGDPDNTQPPLSGDLAQMEQTLTKLYGNQCDNRGGLGGSQPKVARWLGDIRKYFPSSVVKIMQQDAIAKYDLQHLLMEPEILQTLEPSAQLLADIISLSQVVPDETKETAHELVQKIVNDLIKRLSDPMRQAIRGAINRSLKTKRPKGGDIDWPSTIRVNLKNYQPELNTIIPEQLIGFGRKSSAIHQEIILCIDQSGSMATSVVYSSIFAAVLASIPSIATKMVVFDTSIVDLTEKLQDPVDVLFGCQLGGGTDINQAVHYCERYIRSPAKTTLVLVTDLYEGGNDKALVKRIHQLKESDVNVIVLLALSDDGAPSYDEQLAQTIRNLNVPVFACTPDQFPQLIADAIQRKDHLALPSP